ncbi:hypothetical protein P153DRAFT_401483 [Dothidotthia symphoricarpi CBS 119687]|uniref:Uncharacterized protein n=1 Tax=Dothidotthia symphoricarpi CBS 119687 TaxID=1392245 RepID=A0A6A5ZZR4_9PLEO|nr:uncharacterized protein P153DRAFT_401483 [Dothidotthia symphoricarpi CBS 119687]KAF2123928.1 hypothetical protein P153DRAFT_401483 [Dothidotthia symphoricarpi CBS 119687]
MPSSHATSHALTKSDQTQTQAHTQDRTQEYEQEHHKSAQASVIHPFPSFPPSPAGLNLNLFTALSGALSSSSKKTTHKNVDGSETSVEEGNGRAAVQGGAQGHGDAFAGAHAEEGGRVRGGVREGSVRESERKVERVDHLGIEG